jgi:hypothetical protein
VPIGSNASNNINFVCDNGVDAADCENFGTPSIAHFPPGTYQFCEIGVMPGWSNTLSSIGVVFTPGIDNSEQCVDISIPDLQGVLDVNLGTINNQPPPGGNAHTIGFWKNWTSCDGHGNQAPVLDYVLWSFGKYTTVDAADTPDDVSTLWTIAPWLDTPPYDTGVMIGKLKVATCEVAVSVLSKQLLDGKKKARGDMNPFFNSASQLLAAKLNIQAGADVPPCLNDIISRTDQYLNFYNYNGSYADPISGVDKTNLLALAGYLDLYNNNNLSCGSVVIPPAPVGP